MPMNAAYQNVQATAGRAAATHAQLYSGDPGAAGTSNAVGSRVAVTWAAVANGDYASDGNVAFTDLPANQAVTHVGYWSAASSGTYYGDQALNTTPPNDTVANAAGDISLALSINQTAS